MLKNVPRQDAMWGGRIRTNFWGEHWDFRGEFLPEGCTEHGFMTITTEGRACADLSMGMLKCWQEWVILHCPEVEDWMWRGPELPGAAETRDLHPWVCLCKMQDNPGNLAPNNHSSGAPFPEQWSGHRCGFEEGASPAHLSHWLPRAASSRWGPGCQWGRLCGWPGRPPGRHGAGMSHLGCPLPGSSAQSSPWTLQGQQKTEHKTLQAP